MVARGWGQGAGELVFSGHSLSSARGRVPQMEAVMLAQ